MQARQGDLLIVKVHALPADCIKRSHRVLAEGELTGHKHELDLGQVYEREGTIFFHVPQELNAILRHDEHGPITLMPGFYRVIRQREYDRSGWRSIAD